MPLPAEPPRSLPVRDLLLNSTASSTLDGLPPRFESPENLRIPQIVLVALCLPLITLATGMRVYTQKFVNGRLCMEDYSLIVAYFFMTAAAGFMFHAAASTTWTIDLESVLVLLKDTFFVEIFYNITMAFLKTSIILQCLRIFAPHGRADRLMYFGNWTILVACIIAYTTLTFVRIIDCSSHAAVSDQPRPGVCVDRTVLLLFYSVWNFVSNFVILALPLGRIWNLRMPRKDKINMSGLFGVGALAQLVQNDDFTWYAPTVALTGIAEATFGFFCACLPVFPKFLQSMRGEITSLSPQQQYQGKHRPSFDSEYRSVTDSSLSPYSSHVEMRRISSPILMPKEQDRCRSLDSGMRRYSIKPVARDENRCSSLGRNIRSPAFPTIDEDESRCSSLGRKSAREWKSPVFQRIDEELASSFSEKLNKLDKLNEETIYSDSEEGDVLMRPEAIHPALRPPTRSSSRGSCVSRYSSVGRSSRSGERPISHLAQLHLSWQDQDTLL